MKGVGFLREKKKIKMLFSLKTWMLMGFFFQIKVKKLGHLILVKRHAFLEDNWKKKITIPVQSILLLTHGC